MSDFVQISGRDFIRGGQIQRYRGLSLGNWLLLEQHMFGLPNVEMKMRHVFAETLPGNLGREFFDIYQETSMGEKDFAWLHECGVNFIRLPFNYRLLMDDQRPDVIREEGFHHIDRTLTLAQRYGMVVMLDMHAVPGGQSVDWNADNPTGEALFWSHADFRRRFCELWTAIAKRYAHHEAVFGYDLMCEPVASSPVGPRDHALLNKVFHEVTQAIRSVDPHHIIVYEANDWGRSIEHLDPTLWRDPQTTYSPHLYIPQICDIKKYDVWSVEDRGMVETAIAATIDQERIERPVIWGELGMDQAAPRHDILISAHVDYLDCLERLGFSWGMWAYKDKGRYSIMSPAAETPWQRYIGQEKWQQQKTAIEELCFPQWHRSDDCQGSLFHNLREIFPNRNPEELKHQMRETFRALEVLALREIAEDLAANYDATAIRDLASSFAFDRCEPFQPFVDFFTSYWQRNSQKG